MLTEDAEASPRWYKSITIKECISKIGESNLRLRQNLDFNQNLIATLTETFFAIYKRVTKLQSPTEKLDGHSE